MIDMLLRKKTMLEPVDLEQDSVEAVPSDENEAPADIVDEPTNSTSTLIGTPDDEPDGESDEDDSWITPGQWRATSTVKQAQALRLQREADEAAASVEIAAALERLFDEESAAESLVSDRKQDVEQARAALDAYHAERLASERRLAVALTAELGVQAAAVAAKRLAEQDAHRRVEAARAAQLERLQAGGVDLDQAGVAVQVVTDMTADQLAELERRLGDARKLLTEAEGELAKTRTRITDTEAFWDAPLAYPGNARMLRVMRDCWLIVNAAQNREPVDVEDLKVAKACCHEWLRMTPIGAEVERKVLALNKKSQAAQPQFEVLRKDGSVVRPLPLR